jgi:glycosyltransferase involved in cell wall biosynthesis
MKIVRVIARLNVGGPAKHVVWLTQGLQPPEWNSILVAGTVPPGEDDMGYFATSMGVSPVFVREMSREISPRDLLTIWKLFRILRREQPDIIHTHTAKAGTVGRIAGLLYRWLTPQTLVGRPRKCKLVHTYHGHIFHSYYGPFKTRVFLAIEKVLGSLITDRIVVISDQQRKEINEEFKVGARDKFSVIPLGLDLSVFAGWQDRRNLLKEELALDDEDIAVGIIGRLTEVKNHKLFLQSAAAFKKMSGNARRDRVRFVVIGDGSLRTELERQARELGLQEDVIFLGSRRDMENVYPALDIVALSSLNEGTPLTLIEAMANARPVISTSVGGVIDLLGSVISEDADSLFTVCERGIGVRPGDAEAFAKGLSRLVGDVGLRREMGQRSLQFVNSRYSKDRLLEDVRKLYVDLHGGNKLPARAHPGEQRLESRF